MTASCPNPASMPPESSLKAVISVSQMARMVSLSRSRFYSLMEQGIFPRPLYLIRTRRPVYNAEMQAACLAVRQRGIGFETGEPILFYEPRGSSKGSSSISLARKKKPKAKVKTVVDPVVARLIDGLKQLGLNDLKPTVVASALADCYSDGTEGVESGAILAAVYRRLRTQN